MEKLSPQDKEALEKAKKDLGDYLDSCVFLQDTKQLRRFTRSFCSFLRREGEIIRLKEVDVEVLGSRLEIREGSEVDVIPEQARRRQQSRNENRVMLCLLRDEKPRQQ